MGSNVVHLEGSFTLLIDKIPAILRKDVVDDKIIDNPVSIQHIEYVPPPEKTFKAVFEGCLKRKCLEFSYYFARERTLLV